jgi:hypothetical protein
VQFTAKSDTEYGPLTGVIVLQTNADNASSQVSKLDSAYIDIAGIRAGLFYSWWDDGLSGETDDIGSIRRPCTTRFVTSTKPATSTLASALMNWKTATTQTGETANNVGVAVGLGGKAGAFTYQVTAGYDTDNEEGAVRAMGTVAIGPGVLGLAGIYSTARTPTTISRNGFSLLNTQSRQPTS